MQDFGIVRAMELRRAKPGILIINYHRIGQASASCFDRGVFSATTEELDAQVKYFKKQAVILTGEELRSIVSGETKLKQFSVYFTFDDGYLDNYTSAYEVLRSNGVTGAFFLVTSYVGTATIPWWDEIAYCVRNTSQTELCLTYPTPLRVRLSPLSLDREPSISAILEHYKRTDNVMPDVFMQKLREATGCSPTKDRRRFLSWEEAKKMHEAGMEIGSHTVTHPILSRLTPDLQRHEIEYSKKEIEARIGSKISAVAYPVGSQNCFDHVTEKIALSLGYSMCFSFYGGVNRGDSLRKENLLRASMPRHFEIFRAKAAMVAALR